jgi:hypothetical protein
VFKHKSFGTLHTIPQVTRCHGFYQAFYSVLLYPYFSEPKLWPVSCICEGLYGGDGGWSSLLPQSKPHAYNVYDFNIGLCFLILSLLNSTDLIPYFYPGEGRKLRSTKQWPQRSIISSSTHFSHQDLTRNYTVTRTCLMDLLSTLNLKRCFFFSTEPIKFITLLLLLGM